jgi:quercetin dioxygenase-like cupin family protein
MDDTVNLAEKLDLLDRPFRPGIVGFLNDYKLVVVKADGEFVWHKHDDTDDFFLVLKGHLTIQLRDRDVHLSEASCSSSARRGACPKADEEAHILLIEPRGADPPPGRYSRGRTIRCRDAAVHRLGPGAARRVAVRDRRDDPVRRPAR